MQRKLDRIVEEKAAQNTFGAVAAERLDNMAANGLAETTLIKNRWMLQVLAAPLAHRPIAEIMPIEVLDVLKRIEKSGRVQTAIEALPTSLEHIRVGKLRALAVTTAMRSEALPDIPTVGEFLPGYEVVGWVGVGHPRTRL